MAKFDDLLAQAREQNPRVRPVTIHIPSSDPVQVAVRPATLAEYNAWKTQSNSPSDQISGQANAQLFRFCCVVPDPKSAEFDQLLREYPGISDTVAASIKSLSGLSIRAEVGE